MHQAVSLMPCLHTYCGGCFSDWIKRGMKDCPNCRDDIIMVKKNATLNSTIESFLTVYPELKRSQAEIDELDLKNIFKHDIVSTNLLSLWSHSSNLRPMEQLSKTKQRSLLYPSLLRFLQKTLRIHHQTKKRRRFQWPLGGNV